MTMNGSPAAPLIINMIALWNIALLGKEWDEQEKQDENDPYGKKPMMNALAALLPMCYVYVATDADYPRRILNHEMAHCWGWKHPERKENPKFGQLKSSFKIPWKYVLKGTYPLNRLVVYYDVHGKIAKECEGNPYGCAWGGLQK